METPSLQLRGNTYSETGVGDVLSSSRTLVFTRVCSSFTFCWKVRPLFCQSSRPCEPVTSHKSFVYLSVIDLGP